MASGNKTIIVPIDFGEQSLLALEQSYSMARLADAHITLLHVIIESNPFWGIFTAKEKEDTANKFKQKLDGFAEVVAKKSGIPVHTIVEKGKLIEKILEVCDRLNTKFLVVGTTINDTLKEKIVGSNSIRIIREAKCPVVTIKGKSHSQSYKNIILPLDMSKETKQKVNHAMGIAKYFNSTVHAVTVATTKDFHLTERLKGQLEQVKVFLTKNKINCETEFIRPETNETLGQRILKYGYEVGGDLLIIMTRQEDGITEYLVGSTAKELIHGSEIPVMSIAPN